MAVPSLSASVPSHGSTDVYINRAISLVFTDALDSATVNDNTIQLVDTKTNDRVPITVTYTSSTKTITALPKSILKENTPYRVLVIGNDLKVTQSLSGAEASDDLTTSIVIEFTTGDDQYDIDTTVEKEASNKTLEGELFLPTNVKALGDNFTIEQVRPRNYSSDVGIELTGDRTVKFTFSQSLMTGVSTVDWLEIDTYPLLDDQYLGLSGQQLQATSAGDYTLPSGNIGIAGDVLTVTFDRPFPNNAGMSILLTDNITSVSGELYGGSMVYTISTELYPKPIPERSVKQELRHISSDHIYDTWVAFLNHKNSVMLWERSGRSLSLSSLSYLSKKWIYYSTMIDIMEDQDYRKFLLAGGRRQLGDMNVSIDSLIGRVAMKVESAKRERDRVLNTMHAGWQFKTVQRAANVSILEQSRLWYDINGRFTAAHNKFDQPDIPASNTALSRRAKTTNPGYGGF